jgi:hypothetical protein
MRIPLEHGSARILGLTAAQFALVWIGTGASSERGAEGVGFK